MLPTTDDINAAFVTDNSLEHEQETEEELLLNANGKVNNEFETNISKDIAEDADNVDNVENVEVVNAGEEVIDNLNKYSSISSSMESANNADGDGDGDADREQLYNEELDEGNSVDAADDDAGVDSENFNSNLSVIRNEKLAEEFSSDDEEDTEATATEMHPTFNEEWNDLNEADKYDVLSNAISEEDDVEKFNVKPFDLSRDTDVNNDANLPINPDAVYIDGYSPTGYMPRFEKLSLDNNPPTK